MLNIQSIQYSMWLLWIIDIFSFNLGVLDISNVGL